MCHIHLNAPQAHQHDQDDVSPHAADAGDLDRQSWSQYYRVPGPTQQQQGAGAARGSRPLSTCRKGVVERTLPHRFPLTARRARP